MKTMTDYIGLSIAVISDWRVIAATLGLIIMWAILRYVGMVYNRSPRSLARKAPRPTVGAPKAGSNEAAKK